MKVMLLDMTKYANVLAGIGFSSSDIENIIRTYPLTFIPYRDSIVESKMYPPVFARSFYSYAYNFQTIPEQSEFWNFYLGRNMDYFKRSSFPSQHIYGMKAKVYRAYPSFVAELHFALYLKENLDADTILYNPSLDADSGIDIAIESNGQLLALCLYIGTRQSIAAREIKKKRHEQFTNCSYLDLPLNISIKTCGNFSLYGANELSIVKTMLNGRC
jgi:hypothetical protein